MNTTLTHTTAGAAIGASNTAPRPGAAPTRTVLILGANGRFGLAAAQAFAAAGWRVLAQVRRSVAPGMPPSAIAVRAGLDDVGGLARAAAGASVVVYGVNPAYTRWNEELMPLARAGMDVAERLGASFMLPGNVYNFGDAMPPLLRESTPERPSTDKGRQRCELEAEMAARTARGLHSVVVRAGDFFGTGTGNWFDQAITKSVRSGKLAYPGPLDVAHAWAYLPDFARCFVALAEARGNAAERPATAERFHFPGHTLTGRELLAAIEAAATDLGLGRPRGFRHGRMPWGVVRAVAWAVPMWRELLKMRYLWSVPHALSGDRLAAAIGTVPTTPLADALRNSLRDLYIHPAPMTKGVAAA